MAKKTAGFTVFELIVALLVGAALTSIAYKGFADTRAKMSVRQARTLWGAMVARTRAHAIEEGMSTLLITDARGDSVMIFKGGSVVEKVRFAEEMDIDIRSTNPVTTVCMTPRGFANPDCNSFTTTTKISFAQGQQTEVVEILPLGQVRW